MDATSGRPDLARASQSLSLLSLPRHLSFSPRWILGLGLGLLFGALGCVAAPNQQALTRTTLREQPVTVVFSTRIVPRGEAALESPQIKLRLPIASPQQTLGKVQVEGKPKRIKDRWNSPVAVYERPSLRPDENLVGRWSVSARVREFQWKQPQTGSGRAAALSPEERNLYLRDDPTFALSNQVVLEAARQACDGKTDDWTKLDGIFQLVMDRLQYERDGKWDPAPDVLTSGKASCSEFSYSFIALCRASGIPARYVGGIVGRADEPFHVDTVFHRYPQAFVSDVGWVDFDPTRTDRAPDRRLYFGRTSPNMLLLCVGDGGEGSVTGWDYLESHQWAGGGAKAARIRTGWWFPEPPPIVRKAVERFRKKLVKSQTDRNALIAEALRINHPLVLPWLDDLLYERAVRVDAAAAFLKIGGNAAVRAVVGSLGRLQDREGDRQIGDRLNVFTGQQWGCDRAKWQEWLNTRRAPPPTSGTQTR